MASGYRGSVVESLGRLFDAGSVVGLGEAQLLERFLAHGDEAAFEAILAAARADGPGRLPPRAG